MTLASQSASREAGRRAARPVPGLAHGEGGIDRVEHVAEAGRHVLGLGQGEADAVVLDLARARVSRWPGVPGGDQEGAGHAPGVESEHELQHQRRAHPRLDRRMGADEHQVQHVVGRGGSGHVGALLLQQGEVGAGCGGDLCAPAGVDQAVPRGGDEPGLGTVGDTAVRPGLERAQERVGQGVGGGGDGARAHREGGGTSLP